MLGRSDALSPFGAEDCHFVVGDVEELLRPGFRQSQVHSLVPEVLLEGAGDVGASKEDASSQVFVGFHDDVVVICRESFEQSPLSWEQIREACALVPRSGLGQSLLELGEAAFDLFVGRTPFSLAPEVERRDVANGAIILWGVFAEVSHSAHVVFESAECLVQLGGWSGSLDAELEPTSKEPLDAMWHWDVGWKVVVAHLIRGLREV